MATDRAAAVDAAHQQPVSSSSPTPQAEGSVPTITSVSVELMERLRRQKEAREKERRRQEAREAAASAEAEWHRLRENAERLEQEHMGVAKPAGAPVSEAHWSSASVQGAPTARVPLKRYQCNGMQSANRSNHSRSSRSHHHRRHLRSRRLPRRQKQRRATFPTTPSWSPGCRAMTRACSNGRGGTLRTLRNGLRTKPLRVSPRPTMLSRVRQSKRADSKVRQRGR